MKNEKQVYHYVEEYFHNPHHPITVDLIGVGGTGSQVLTALARIDHALRKLDHPGLHIRAFDPDKVSEANIGRQMFAESETGLNKAVVLISRINRFFGVAYQAYPVKYESPERMSPSNIVISCVDSIDTRKKIKNKIKPNDKNKYNHGVGYTKDYYWIDAGNTQNTAQIVLCSTREIEQPRSHSITTTILPSLFDLYPEILKQEEEDSGPSCSLAEALNSQDLFINSITAQYVGDLVWKMFRKIKLDTQGIFINLETSKTSPIKIKYQVK